MSGLARRLGPLLAAVVLVAASPPVDGQRSPDACDTRSRGYLVTFCVTLPGALGRSVLGDLGDRGITLLASHGVAAERVATERGFLVVERAVGSNDRYLLALALEDDIEQLETDFGRAFASTPKVYVFATRVTFSSGIEILFLYTEAVARQLAAHGGVLDPTTLGTAVNWDLVGSERPVTIIRHELTHAIVRQILGPDNAIPTWFDEGLAMLEQETIAGTETKAIESRYLAAALLANARVSLAQLATMESWLRASEAQGIGTYAIAEAALRTLSDRVGTSGLVSLLGQVGRGVPFDVAFERAGATPMEDFAAGLPDALADRVVLVVVVDDRARQDGNAIWTVRGASAGANVSVTFRGAAGGYEAGFVVRADEFGMYTGSFGATAPAGEYLLEISDGQTTASTRFEARHD